MIRFVGLQYSYLFILQTKIRSLCYIRNFLGAKTFVVHWVLNRSKTCNTGTEIFIIPSLTLKFCYYPRYWWIVIFISWFYLNHSKHVSQRFLLYFIMKWELLFLFFFLYSRVCYQSYCFSNGHFRKHLNRNNGMNF